MSDIGLLGSMFLLGFALLVVGLPFLPTNKLWGSSREPAAMQYERDDLLTTYERVLATIRDLDEDYRTGKMTQESYQQERSHWTEQGIMLLQKLEPDLDDKEADLPAVEEVPTRGFVDEDDPVEAAIRAYKQAQPYS